MTQTAADGTPYYIGVDNLGNATDDSDYNIANWDEVKKYYSAEERKQIQDKWEGGTQGAQRVVILDDGSFLVTQKAMVKYNFHAVAGQTYYLFSNFSKMGFAGVSFVKDDKQPDDALNLSETEEYKPNTEKETPNDAPYPMYSEVTLDRSFTAGTWSSICLPFTMTEKEVKDVFGDSTQLIMLDKVTIEGSKAYIYIWYIMRYRASSPVILTLSSQQRVWQKVISACQINA